MKNVENGNLSNEGFTIIPSCNNRFANVKFRLKKKSSRNNIQKLSRGEIIYGQ